MKFGIVRFPGSNCDADCFYLLRDELKEEGDYIWHEEIDVFSYDCIILPGGFSFGDYLRTGALASLSPIVESIKKFAANGGNVIGICNGFQILTEAHLLPGVLLRNRSCSFICKTVPLSVENIDTPFTSLYKHKEIIYLPIAHGEGCYYADKETCNFIEKNNMVVFRYVGPNPNGSVNGIAGICNKERNVIGLMPHPERASSTYLGKTDGIRFWQSVQSLCKVR